MSLTGTPHYCTTAKLAPEVIAKVRALVAERGWQPTARLLGTATTTVERICGAGVLQPSAVARITEAVARVT